MHLKFLASPLGTCLMLTCSHFFTLSRQRNGMEGKIVLREAVLAGMARPVVLPAYCLRLADPPSAVSWVSLC